MKKYKWTPNESPNDDSYYDHTKLETPLGEIIIEWKSWKEWPSFDIFNRTMNEWVGSEDSLDDAKIVAEKYLEDKYDELGKFITPDSVV